MSIHAVCDSVARAFLNKISIANVRALADTTIKESFEDLVTRLGADAGAIWIVDESDPSKITIAVNVGSRGGSIEGEVSQDLDSGLVSKAFKQEELICDSGMLPHTEKSFDVDRKLEQMTLHQIAGPFKMFGKTIGAMTVAQFVTDEANTKRVWGFDEQAKESFRRFTAVTERLFEYEAVKASP